MVNYDDIKTNLATLKKMVQKVQIKKYSGVAALSLSQEREIAAEIQLIGKNIGKIIQTQPTDKRKKLVSVREKLGKMLKSDQFPFAVAYSLPNEL